MTRNDSFINKHAGSILIVLAVFCAFMAWFATSKDKTNRENEAANHASIAAKVESQRIVADFSDVSSEDRCSRSRCFLSSIITDDWVFLNLEKPEWESDRYMELDECSRILKHFVLQKNKAAFDFYGWYQSWLPLEFGKQPVTLNVYVPKFTKNPSAFMDCKRMQYDEASQTFKRGHRTIALLSPHQPQLRKPK